jgi:transposase
MSEITLIGIDLAKNIFRINCLDRNGKRVMNKNLHRGSVISFFAALPECTVAMEACASSHYWGRTIESLGHTVKLIHPRYVTPYRLGDKNDANDAAAICAAAQRPDMRFVRVRSQRQSDVQSLHRVREGLVTEKTATVNRIRSLLAENGIVIKQGPANVYALLPVIIDDANNDLSGMMRQLLRIQYTHLVSIRDQLAELEKMLRELVAEEDAYTRLTQIPGVGLITATLLGSELGNGSAFRNGRSFAAYLGLTQRQHSSGGKNTLLGINKRGNRYLRTLLIHCARAVLRSLALGKSPFGGGALEQWMQAYGTQG